MTSDEILAANPGSVLIQLYNPYKRTVRFIREDDIGQHYCEPPSDWRVAFYNKFSCYKPIVRHIVGRAVV